MPRYQVVKGVEGKLAQHPLGDGRRFAGKKRKSSADLASLPGPLSLVDCYDDVPEVVPLQNDRCVEKALRQGALEALSKPFVADSLADAVSKSAELKKHRASQAEAAKKAAAAKAAADKKTAASAAGGDA